MTILAIQMKEVALSMTDVCSYAEQLIEEWEIRGEYGEFAVLHAERLEGVAVAIRRMHRQAQELPG